MVAIKQKSPWLKDIKIKAIDIVNKEYSGNSPPTVFVGSKLMDEKKTNVGVLSPLETKEEAWKYDAPHYWYKENYSIKKIAELRANLINARKEASIFDVRNSNKFLELAQEIAMARKVTGIEVELKKKLNANLKFDKIHMPFGPGGEIQKIEAVENIKLEPKVEKVFYDTDLKANSAIKILNSSGFNENEISQFLSIGVMGLKYNRKLVPTKWSITATDDNIGKDLIKEIKQNNIIQDYRLIFGNYLGNYYLILLFPQIFSYELFESSMPDQLLSPDQDLWTTSDYENYDGRKSYADNTVGGYYAARLSLLEYMKDNKMQAGALLLRFVTSEYSVPLGVFVVRQAVRKTISNSEMTFESRDLMLNVGRSIIYRKFGYNIDNLLKKSLLLNEINKHRKLIEF